jgi:hypothetical protein
MAAGLGCIKCISSSVVPEVRVYFKSHLLKSFDSALKAMNYALESCSTPCLLHYVYVCQKCGFEEVKHEKYYDEVLPEDFYLGKIRNDK